MKFIIIFFIILTIIIIYNYHYSDYPNNLDGYVIYGKLDNKDKKTYHYQFKKNEYYKLNKYGNLLKKGLFTFKRENKKIILHIDEKKFNMEIIPTKKKYVFFCKNGKRKILLIKIIKKKYVKNLDGKIVKFTNFISDTKNNKLKYKEFINYYGKKTYTKFDPFINQNENYKYYVNDYGKAYIILENSIVKLLYENNNRGIFILKSGNKIIEGNFKILN